MQRSLPAKRHLIDPTFFVLVALICFCLVSCRRTPPPSDEAPPPIVIPEEQELRGTPHPRLADHPATCESNDECRTWRPEAWNPRVECCYEYGCQLGWEPIHDAQWALLRAWRSANPFDCAEELAESGTCDTSPRGCGLRADPPPSVCEEGRCALAWPTRWPEIDADAQTCSTSSDCTALPLAAFDALERCCNTPCEERSWIALRRDEARTVETWLRDSAPSCDHFEDRERFSECTPVETCGDEPPSARCRAGFCALDR